MRRNRFTRDEAWRKVGKKVRTKVEFSGVPKGAEGEVIKATEMEKLPDSNDESGYDVVVRWYLPQRGKPLDDWFTKDEYQRFLEEL